VLVFEVQSFGQIEIFQSTRGYGFDNLIQLKVVAFGECQFHNLTIHTLADHCLIGEFFHMIQSQFLYLRNFFQDIA
jgi:hypothetical protein